MGGLSRLTSQLYEARSGNPSSTSLTEEESEIIDEIMSGTSLEYLDHGSGRIVFRDADTVVKFARGGDGRHNDGRRQHEAEIKIGTANKNSPYFAHPISWGPSSLWVRFPYAQQVSRCPEFDEHDAVRIATHLKDHIPDSANLNTLDIRRENVGIHNGEQAKLIDYGSIDDV